MKKLLQILIIAFIAFSSHAQTKNEILLNSVFNDTEFLHNFQNDNVTGYIQLFNGFKGLPNNNQFFVSLLDLQNLDSTWYESWDESSNQWLSNGMTKNTYNLDGYIETYSSYTWSEIIKKWIGEFFTEYNYNYNGKTNLLINKIWDNNTNQWIPNMKSVFTYETNGENTRISYGWDMESFGWIPSYKEEILNSENGKPILDILFNWNKNDNI